MKRELTAMKTELGVQLILALVLLCSTAPSVVHVPKGADIVFNPSTNATWWLTTVSGDDVLLNQDSDHTTVDEQGNLRVKIHSTEQSGRYKLIFYVKSKDQVWDASQFPVITFHETKEHLECQMEEKEVTIVCWMADLCVEERVYYLGVSPTNETGHYRCFDSSGEQISVIAQGTEFLLVPSTTATWWRSVNPDHEVQVDVSQEYARIDQYGRLIVTMYNNSLSGDYKLRFYSKVGSEETEWTADDFSRIDVVETEVPQDRYIMTSFGERTILTCGIRGNGDHIIWYKDSKEISSGKTMVIRNTTDANSGLYICFKGTIGQARHVSIQERITTAAANTEDDEPGGSMWTVPVISVVIIILVIVIGIVIAWKRRQQHHKDSGTNSNMEEQQQFLCTSKTSNEPSINKPNEVDEFAEKVRTQYKAVLVQNRGYKPVLHVDIPSGKRDIFISPQLRFDKGPDKLKEIVSKHTDIFTLIHSVSEGSRVIISADAGHGKSALLNNVCWQWVNKHPIAVKYKIVFCGSLQEVKHKKLIDIVINDFTNVPVENYTNLERLLNETDNNILWLLDSYEDLNPIFQDGELVELLKGGICKKSTIILTSRPHCIQQLIDSFKMNTLLSIQKFSEEQREEYIEKFNEILKNADSEQSTDHLNQVIKYIPSELLCVPLFIAVLCYLWYIKGSEVCTDINTQTKLLSVLLKKSIQDSSKKLINKPGVKPVFSISPLETTIDVDTRTKLIHFGEVCFDVLQDGKHILEIADLQKAHLAINTIGEIGIGDLVDISEHGRVTFTHTLVQEYLAAVYLISSEPRTKLLLKKIQMKKTLSLRDAFGKYLHVVLFAVGMKPELLNMVPSSKEGKIDYQRLECHSQLYDECQSEDERKKFLSHLENLTPEDDLITGTRNYITHTSTMLRDMRQAGIIVNWGKKLGLCTIDKGTIMLCGEKVVMEGEVLGSLMNISHRILVDSLEVHHAYLNVTTLYKVTRQSSQTLAHTKRETDGNIKIKLRHCHLVVDTGVNNESRTNDGECSIQLTIEKCSFESASILFSLGKIAEMTIRNTHNLFNTRNKDDGVSHATCLTIEKCGQVELEVISCGFPDLTHLTLRYSIMKHSTQISPFSNVSKLEIDNCSEVELTDIAQFFPCLADISLRHVNITASKIQFPCSNVTSLRIARNDGVDLTVVARQFPAIHTLSLLHSPLIKLDSSPGSIADNITTELKKLKTFHVRAVTDIPPLYLSCPKLETLITCIRGDDKDIPLNKVAECMHGFSSGIHLVLVYFRTLPARHRWFSDVDSEQVQQVHGVTSLTTSNVKDLSQITVLKRYFPKAKITNIDEDEMKGTLERKHNCYMPKHWFEED